MFQMSVYWLITVERVVTQKTTKPNIQITNSIPVIQTFIVFDFQTPRLIVYI